MLIIGHIWRIVKQRQQRRQRRRWIPMVTRRCQLWFVSKHLAFCSFNFRAALSLAAWRWNLTFRQWELRYKMLQAHVRSGLGIWRDVHVSDRALQFYHYSTSGNPHVSMISSNFRMRKWDKQAFHVAKRICRSFTGTACHGWCDASVPALWPQLASATETGCDWQILGVNTSRCGKTCGK